MFYDCVFSQNLLSSFRNDLFYNLFCENFMLWTELLSLQEWSGLEKLPQTIYEIKMMGLYEVHYQFVLLVYFVLSELQKYLARMAPLFRVRTFSHAFVSESNPFSKTEDFSSYRIESLE
jgi:hypothetical protein